MRRAQGVLVTVFLAFFSLSLHASDDCVSREFNPASDLLLAHFDSKPDVDDLQSVAALGTILRSEPYQAVNYRAVAGAYGTQDGTYIESPELFTLAFGDRWVDAHNHREQALGTIVGHVMATLKAGGDIWVEEAGQSDFTADVLALVRERDGSIKTRERFHVVQHSVWNERVTTDDKLLYVRDYTDYRKIPDGNAPGNGTPNYKSDSGADWERVLAAPDIGAIWKEAKTLSDQYNGKTGYDNPAVKAGGFDFSDTVEVVNILGIDNVETVGAFFDRFVPSP